jgi:hypothetical protein
MSFLCMQIKKNKLWTIVDEVHENANKQKNA